MRQHALPCTPQKQSRVGSFFSNMCLLQPNFFPKEIVEFVGDIRTRTPKTRFYVIATQTQLQQR